MKDKCMMTPIVKTMVTLSLTLKKGLSFSVCPIITFTLIEKNTRTKCVSRHVLNTCT